MSSVSLKSKQSMICLYFIQQSNAVVMIYLDGGEGSHVTSPFITILSWQSYIFTIYIYIY